MDAPKPEEIAEIAKKAVHLDRWLQPLLAQHNGDINAIFKGIENQRLPEMYHRMLDGCTYDLELDHSEEGYLYFGGYWRGEQEHSVEMSMEYLSDYQTWLQKAIAKRDEILADMEAEQAERETAKAEAEAKRVAKIKSDYQDLVEKGLA